MKRAIEETERRRRIQKRYNIEHAIIPKTVQKMKEHILQQTDILKPIIARNNLIVENSADTIPEKDLLSLSAREIEGLIKKMKKKMNKAAKNMDFFASNRT